MGFTGRLRIEEALEELTERARRGVLAAGEHVLGVSNAHAPIEEGTLERSGKVTSADTADGGITVAISYDTPYAARQHEETTWRHDDGRTAKYLENAMNSERATCAQIIARAAREDT